MASSGADDLDPGGDATGPTFNPAAIAPSGRTIPLGWGKRLEERDNHSVATSVAAHSGGDSRGAKRSLSFFAHDGDASNVDSSQKKLIPPSNMGAIPQPPSIPEKT
jgi:hypothetical protein